MLLLQLHNVSQTRQVTPILLFAFLRLILLWETASLSIGRLPQPTWLTYEAFPLFRSTIRLNNLGRVMLS
jgi:hypothetical protein